MFASPNSVNILMHSAPINGPSWLQSFIYMTAYFPKFYLTLWPAFLKNSILPPHHKFLILVSTIFPLYTPNPRTQTRSRRSAPVKSAVVAGTTAWVWDILAIRRLPSCVRFSCGSKFGNDSAIPEHKVAPMRRLIFLH